MPPNASLARSVTTGASGSRASTSTAMLPYWPSVTPAMPTSAWAIIASAGERRGRVGIAGRSYSRRANAAASWTDRCGRLPTPVAAPARSPSPSGGTRCRTRCGPVRAAVAGRRFDRGHRSSSPPRSDALADALCCAHFYSTDVLDDGSRRRRRIGHVRRWSPPSANLLAVPDIVPPRAASGTRRLGARHGVGRPAGLAGRGRVRRPRRRRRRRGAQRRRAGGRHRRLVGGVGAPARSPSPCPGCWR